MVSNVEPHKDRFPLPGRLFFIIVGLAALVYALLAGLRTVADFDLGWQLATARWVVQHHQIPSTDVLSYTAQGQPWIYPIGSGLIFYAAYLMGGYALLSWVGAAVCVGTVALILRRGSALTAAIAILAVPLIANRTTPRADMFTVVLFAAFLSLLWQQYKTGRAPLWLLPVLTIAWANLHLGLVSGLALLGGYVMLEVLDMPWPGRRRIAAEHLRRAWPWLAATVVSTLANPWGWKSYSNLFNFMSPMASTSTPLLAEWTSATLSWSAVVSGLWLRNPDSFILLLMIVAIAVPVALARRQLGAALLLTGATVLGVRHLRLQVLFSLLVVVIAGAVLTSAIDSISLSIINHRSRNILATAACSLLVVLVAFWSADLVTDRSHVRRIDLSSFGTGLSWWFPMRAAAFIERERIPGQLFNSYAEGGFIAWRLGPTYPDYVDGRGGPFAGDFIQHSASLMGSEPDSIAWNEEAERYNINAMIIPLGRYDGLQLFPFLRQFCTSNTWKPVYLDEVSVVFVRSTQNTRELVKKLQISCDGAPLPAIAPEGNTSEAFNHWINAAAVLGALGRNAEAFSATTRALAIFPDSPYTRFTRGDLLEQAGALDVAEQEYLVATIHPNSSLLAQWVWERLAKLYGREHKLNQAIAAWEEVIDLTPDPHLALLSLGYAYLNANQPSEALQAFDRAQTSAQKNLPSTVESEKPFYANQAHGRAVACEALGAFTRAIDMEEETVRLAPDRQDDWLALVRLYNREGRSGDAQRAADRLTLLRQGLSK